MRSFRFILLLVAVTSVLAWSTLAADTETSPRIVVSGEGEVSSEPDMVTITLGVQTRNDSASAAVAENADLMNETVQALLAAGIAREDIQTTRYSLRREVCDYGEECDVESLGFVASNQVTVTMNITGETDVGSILDVAVASGSNEVSGISFGLRDPGPLMDRALAEAVEDAARKAGVIASSAGVSLGKVLIIDEAGSYQPVAEFALMRGATPVMQGMVDVTAEVTVAYEIGG